MVLLARNQIKIKIHNDNDNIVIQNNKKSQSITIIPTADKENPGLPKLNKILSLIST